MPFDYLSHDTDHLSVFENVPDAFSIIDYIATLGADIPFHIVRETKNGDKQVDEHWSYDLLSHPNPLSTYTEFMKTFIAYYLVFGNAYMVKIIPKGFADAAQLWVMPSHYMRVVPREEGSKSFLENPVSEYELQYDQGVTIPQELVMHKKYLSLNYESARMLYGMSPLKPAAKITESIASVYDAKISITKYRGAMGILTPEGDSFIDPAEADAIEKKYKEKYGFGRDQINVIISSARMKWSQMTMPIRDLMLIENAKLDFQSLCRIYKFPSALLNDEEGSTYNNMIEKRKVLINNAVKPLINSTFEELSYFLFGVGSRIKVKANWKIVPELQPDKVQLSGRLVNEFDRGVWTPDEVREMLGGEPTGEKSMKQHYIRSGYVDIDSLTEQIALNLQGRQQALERGRQETQVQQEEEIRKALQKAMPN